MEVWSLGVLGVWRYLWAVVLSPGQLWGIYAGKLRGHLQVSSPINYFRIRLEAWVKVKGKVASKGASQLTNYSNVWFDGVIAFVKK